MDYKRVSGEYPYEVEVGHQAAKQIVRLPRAEQVRVSKKIDGLAREPKPPGCEKLSGTKNGYRVRSGNYRILYTVDDGVRVVSVTRVAHRREVYRRL
jgi:mRNA interferase RelE/StbE